MEGVMTALTSQTDMAKEGIAHLGCPAYFGVALAIFKVAGALALIVPQVPARIKEWAYAGFAFDFIFAAISHYAVDGLTAEVAAPFVFLVVLALSYHSYHQLKQAANSPHYCVSSFLFT